MNPTEIDRALRSEQRIEPSARFQSHVMQAVHAHVSSGRKRRVGFGQLWPSLAVASVIVPLLIAVRLLDGPEAQSRDVAQAASWLSFTLTATLAVAWRFTRDMVAE
jgi:hypothetical protein